MQDLKIDSHKLMYHVQRLESWLAGENIYPLYAEISPSGTCNHRCIFCAFEYLRYKKQFIDSSVMKKTLLEMVKGGVKSVMFSGEGEPFLHKDIVEFILYARNLGIDVAAANNGVYYTPEVARKTLSALSWIKVSINAGTAKTYALVHGCDQSDFYRVFENIEAAAKMRKSKSNRCAIGAQIVLLPHNFDEVGRLASKLKRAGADYLVVKPFIKHPSSRHSITMNFTGKKLSSLGRVLEKYNTGGFRVYFRAHSFLKLRQPRPYRKCLALPFFCEITSNGDIFTCGPFLGNSMFCYGNLYEKSFSSIWNGKRRKSILAMVSKSLDIDKCMQNCRLDECNRYLWDLTHPQPHVNFI